MQKFNALLRARGRGMHRPAVIIRAVRNETEIKSDAMRRVPYGPSEAFKKNTASVGMQSVTRFLEIFRRRDRARFIGRPFYTTESYPWW